MANKKPNRSEASIQQRREYSKRKSAQLYAENPDKQKEAMARYRNGDSYKNRAEERREYNRVYQQNLREAKYEWTNQLKLDNGCAKCGYDEHFAALEFHHRDPSQKTKEVATLIKNNASNDTILAEIAKCDILCSNCHQILHYLIRRDKMSRRNDEQQYSEGKIIANNLTDAAETAALRFLLGQSPTAPTTPFRLALFTSDPTETGAAGTEVSSSGTAYVRQTIAFNTESGGASANTSQIDFPAATANWGTITHIGIYDSAGSPVMYWYAPLSASVVINTTDIFRVNAGDITVSLNQYEGLLL